MQATEQLPAAEQGKWFYSVHHDTGQLLFTLDLPEVSLTALVNSLATALQTTPTEEMLQSSDSRPGTGGSPTGDIRLKIRGDHMTLREIFDLIHQQTGCEIFREKGRVLVTVCE